MPTGAKTLCQSNSEVAVRGSPSEFPVFGKWSLNSTGWGARVEGRTPRTTVVGRGVHGGSIQKKNNWWFQAAEVRVGGK